MKAVRVHNYGDSAQLRYEEAPRPNVGKHQVLVEIAATTVNHIDIMMASGSMRSKMPLEFPWTPGVDFAGRIDYAGEEVKGFKPGDEVYGKLYGGTYAEYVAAEAGTFALMPSNLSFAEAATVPHVGLTAWQAVFDHGKIEPGQNILIVGASGAVGSFAVQLAKLAGAFVYAVDKSVNRDYLESIGADLVIDFKEEDFAQVAKDVDLVLDFVGKDTAERSYPVMKNGGIFVSTVSKPPTALSQDGISVIYMGVHPDYDDLAELTQLIEAGKIKTDVAEIFPLSEVISAWENYQHKTESKKEYTHGKIVLKVK